MPTLDLPASLSEYRCKTRDRITRLVIDWANSEQPPSALAEQVLDAIWPVKTQSSWRELDH